MNHLFIRAYDNDDYIARLCYESWMLAGYEGEVIFYCQRKCPHPNYDKEYVPNWIAGCGRIIFHDNLVSNFGGTDGVNALLEGLRQVDKEGEGFVITCDTDIIIKDNPLKYIEAGTAFAGTGEVIKDGFIHISGQVQIISNPLLSVICADDKNKSDNIGAAMIKFGLGICDDTYMSYRAYQMMAKVQILKDKWVHDKLYIYEPRKDWENIIKEVK